MNSFQSSDQQDFDNIARTVDRGFTQQRGILSAIKSGVSNVGEGVASVGRGIKNVYNANKQDFGVNTNELKTRLANGIAGPVGVAINQAMSNAGISFSGIIKKSIGSALGMFHGHGNSNGFDSGFGESLNQLNGINNKQFGNEIQQLNVQRQNLKQGEKQIANDNANTNKIVNSIRDLEDNLGGKVNRRNGRQSSFSNSNAGSIGNSSFDSGNSLNYQPNKNIINSVNRMSRDGSHTMNQNSSPNDVATLLGEIIKNQQLQQQYNQDPNADKTGIGHTLMDMGLTFTGLKFWFGGRYAHDIPRSTNPMETIVNGLIKIYEWERIGIDLSRRQLNELIKLQGGEPQKYIGHEGVFTAFVKNKAQKLTNAVEAKFGTGIIGKALKLPLGVAKFLAMSDEDWKEQGSAKAYNYLNNFGNPERREKISNLLHSSKASRDFLQSAIGADLEEIDEDRFLNRKTREREDITNDSISKLKRDKNVLDALENFNELNQNKNGYDEDTQTEIMKDASKKLRDIVNRAREKYGLQGLLGSDSVENGSIIDKSWYGKTTGHENVKTGETYSIDDLIIDKNKNYKKNRNDEINSLLEILKNPSSRKEYDKAYQRLTLINEELDEEEDSKKGLLYKNIKSPIPVQIVSNGIFSHIDSLLGGESRSKLTLADQIIWGLENSKIGIATRNINEELTNDQMLDYRASWFNKQLVSDIVENINTEKQKNTRERDGLDTTEDLADEAQIQSADDISIIKDVVSKALSNANFSKNKKDDSLMGILGKIAGFGAGLFHPLFAITSTLLSIVPLLTKLYLLYKGASFLKGSYDAIDNAVDKVTKFFGSDDYSDKHTATTTAAKLKAMKAPVKALDVTARTIGKGVERVVGTGSKFAKPFKVFKPVAKVLTPLSSGFDLYDGTNRLLDGQSARGSAQLASGGLVWVPGIGWMTSLGLNLSTIAGDIVAENTGSDVLGEHTTAFLENESAPVSNLAIQGGTKAIRYAADTAADVIYGTTDHLPSAVSNSKTVNKTVAKLTSIASKNGKLAKHAKTAGKFAKGAGAFVAALEGTMETIDRDSEGDTSGAVISAIGTVANTAAQFGGFWVSVAVNLAVRDALMINDLIKITKSEFENFHLDMLEKAQSDFDFLIDKNVHKSMTLIMNDRYLNSKGKIEKISIFYQKWLYKQGKSNSQQRTIDSSRNNDFIKDFNLLKHQFIHVLKKLLKDTSLKNITKLCNGFQAYCYEQWKKQKYQSKSYGEVDSIINLAEHDSAFAKDNEQEDNRTWWDKFTRQRDYSQKSIFHELKEKLSNGQITEEEYKAELYNEYNAYRKRKNSKSHKEALEKISALLKNPNSKTQGKIDEIVQAYGITDEEYNEYVQGLERSKTKKEEETKKLKDNISEISKPLMAGSDNIVQAVNSIGDKISQTIIDTSSQDEKTQHFDVGGIIKDTKITKNKNNKTGELIQNTNTKILDAILETNYILRNNSKEYYKFLKSTSDDSKNPIIKIYSSVNDINKINSNLLQTVNYLEDIIDNLSYELIDPDHGILNTIVDLLIPENKTQTFDNGGIVDVAPGIQYANKPQFGKTSNGQKYVWGEGHDGKGAGEYKISTGTHDIFLPEKREPGNMTDLLMKHFDDGGVVNKIPSLSQITESVQKGVEKGTTFIRESVKKIADSPIGKRIAEAVESTKKYLTSEKFKKDLDNVKKGISNAIDYSTNKISSLYEMGSDMLEESLLELRVDSLDASKGTHKDALIKQFKENNNLKKELKDKEGNQVDISDKSDDEIFELIKSNKKSSAVVKNAWTEQYNKAVEWDNDKIKNQIEKIEERDRNYDKNKERIAQYKYDDRPKTKIDKKVKDKPKPSLKLEPTPTETAKDINADKYEAGQNIEGVQTQPIDSSSITQGMPYVDYTPEEPVVTPEQAAEEVVQQSEAKSQPTEATKEVKREVVNYTITGGLVNPKIDSVTVNGKKIEDEEEKRRIVCDDINESILRESRSLQKQEEEIRNTKNETRKRSLKRSLKYKLDRIKHYKILLEHFQEQDKKTQSAEVVNDVKKEPVSTPTETAKDINADKYEAGQNIEGVQTQPIDSSSITQGMPYVDYTPEEPVVTPKQTAEEVKEEKKEEPKPVITPKQTAEEIKEENVEPIQTPVTDNSSITQGMPYVDYTPVEPVSTQTETVEKIVQESKVKPVVEVKSKPTETAKVINEEKKEEPKPVITPQKVVQEINPKEKQLYDHYKSIDPDIKDSDIKDAIEKHGLNELYKDPGLVYTLSDDSDDQESSREQYDLILDNARIKGVVTEIEKKIPEKSGGILENNIKRFSLGGILDNVWDSLNPNISQIAQDKANKIIGEDNNSEKDLDHKLILMQMYRYMMSSEEEQKSLYAMWENRINTNYKLITRDVYEALIHDPKIAKHISDYTVIDDDLLDTTKIYRKNKQSKNYIAEKKNTNVYIDESLPIEKRLKQLDYLIEDINDDKNLSEKEKKIKIDEIERERKNQLELEERHSSSKGLFNTLKNFIGDIGEGVENVVGNAGNITKNLTNGIINLPGDTIEGVSDFTANLVSSDGMGTHRKLVQILADHIDKNYDKYVEWSKTSEFSGNPFRFFSECCPIDSKDLPENTDNEDFNVDTIDALSEEISRRHHGIKLTYLDRMENRSRMRDVNRYAKSGDKYFAASPSDIPHAIQDNVTNYIWKSINGSTREKTKESLSTRERYDNGGILEDNIKRFANGGIIENPIHDMKAYNTDSRNSAINNRCIEYINNTKGQKEAAEQTLNGLRDMTTAFSQNSMAVINKISNGGNPVTNNIVNNNYDRNSKYEFVEGSPSNIRA